VDAHQTAEKNHVKTVHDITRQLSGRKINTYKPVKGRDSSIFNKPEKQLSRRKKHFSNLLYDKPVENHLN